MTALMPRWERMPAWEAPTARTATGYLARLWYWEREVFDGHRDRIERGATVWDPWAPATDSYPSLARKG